jgi:uncharacterized membrane protein
MKESSFVTNVIRKSSEKTGKHYFRLASVISILVGIILPVAITSKPIDWKWFFYIMAMSIALVWVVYSIILFAYVFLVEGKRNRYKLKMKREEDPFSLHSTKEWEDLWEMSVKRNKHPGMGNHDWN